MFNEIFSYFPDYNIILSLVEYAESKSVQLYLVGGTVRDLVLRKSISDMDFIMSGNVIDFSKGFSEIINAKVIILNKEPDTTRIIFNHGEFYMDFSKMRGTNIVEDLMARDLTINSMALDFNRLVKTQDITLIDPCNGVYDLENERINFTSESSIINDPIRLLRAYRFSALLGFVITDQAKSMIQNYRTLIKTIAGERVRDELFKILSVNNSAYYIKEMDSAGLLEEIFPKIAPMKGMVQNDYHHLDVWGHSMLTMENFENEPIPGILSNYYEYIEDYLNYELVKGRSRKVLLKLAALLHDVGKPSTRTIDINGRVRFFDHHIIGAETAVDILSYLKLSKRENAFICSVIKNHMYPLMICMSKQKQIPAQLKRMIRRYINNVGSLWLPVILISYADMRATRGIRSKPSDIDNMLDLIGMIADIFFNEIYPSLPVIVTGEDLIREFNLSPGPIIGEILKKIRSAQIDENVKTPSEALELARSLLSKVK